MFLNSIVRRNLLSATVLYLQNAYWHREIVVLRISSVNDRNAIRHLTPPPPPTTTIYTILCAYCVMKCDDNLQSRRATS